MNSEDTSPRMAQVSSLAQQLIEGKIGVSYASRQIRDLVWKSYDDPWKHDIFRMFMIIDTETDHLPLGSVRDKWDADALKKKDEEIAAVDAFYRADAIKAAEALLEYLKQ